MACFDALPTALGVSIHPEEKIGCFDVACSDIAKSRRGGTKLQVRAR
jgi:hypothetical protein